MLKISKLLTLLVTISCTYASNIQDNNQKLFQVTKVNSNLINSNIHNIIDNNLINENQNDVKERKKTPQYIKDFCFSQNELDLIKKYLLNKVSQDDNNTLNKEIKNVIDFVNTILKRETQKTYNYNKFRSRPYIYGKWSEINSLEELYNNCKSVIQNIIRHSFAENKTLLNNIKELKKINGNKITKEINNLISQVKNIVIKNSSNINLLDIKSITENKESITNIIKHNIEKILPNDLNKEAKQNESQISNITSCLSKNISDPILFNKYISELRNVLVQYGMYYKYFKDNNKHKTVLANEHFSPFISTRDCKANDLLYEIYNVEDKNKIKINIKNKLVTLEKKRSLIFAENSKLYYIFENTNPNNKYMSLEEYNNNESNEKNTVNTTLKDLQNKKTLLYINYLLHYIASKYMCNNCEVVYENLINNNIFNINNNINDQDKYILDLVANKITYFIRDNNNDEIDNNKKDNLYYSISHSRANNILTKNGEIKKISGNTHNKFIVSGLIDIFDNGVEQQDNESNINDNNISNNNIGSNNNNKENIVNNNNNLNTHEQVNNNNSNTYWQINSNNNSNNILEQVNNNNSNIHEQVDINSNTLIGRKRGNSFDVSQDISNNRNKMRRISNASHTENNNCNQRVVENIIIDQNEEFNNSINNNTNNQNLLHNIINNNNTLIQPRFVEEYHNVHNNRNQISSNNNEVSKPIEFSINSNHRNNNVLQNSTFGPINNQLNLTVRQISNQMESTVRQISNQMESTVRQISNQMESIVRQISNQMESTVRPE